MTKIWLTVQKVACFTGKETKYSNTPLLRTAMVPSESGPYCDTSFIVAKPTLNLYKPS